MAFNAFVILWLAGGCAVLGLAIYRKLVSVKEDDNLHIGEFDTPQVARHAAIASRLDFVDKWGIGLTIAVVALGVLLAGVYIYQQWSISSQLVP